MKRLLLILSACSVGHAEPTKPNILFIVSDDQGWNDVGYRSGKIHTPNIDKLANGGVKLEHHYVLPYCSPTRCAIMSGRHPAQFGIIGPIGGNSELAMPKNIPNLGSMLKTQGYVTALSGKWHLSLQMENGPRQYGFDTTYGYLHGQIDPLKHDYKTGIQTWHRNDKAESEHGHATDLITAEAIRVIEQRRKEPLFLYVAYSVPHEPLIEEARWTQPYEKVFPEKTRQLVAASITHMDDCIGQIITALEKAGLRENTLIVYTTDNGGLKKCDGGDYEGRFKDQVGPHSDNGPLFGWKGDCYEGGILGPSLVNWPAQLQPRVESAVVCAMDWLPTFAALSGFTTTAEMKIEGQNIWPVLTGEQSGGPRTLYFASTNKDTALRSGDYKFIDTKRSEGLLFNIATDPHEQTDLAAQDKQRAQEMKKQLKKWVEGNPEIKKDKKK
jgi:arylsulfatase A-like enzyme